MKLDNIAANIRLRKSWEAFDLGLSMVQTWWKSIYLPWSIFMFALLGLLMIIASSDYATWAIFILWWLKPLYDRLLLNILSQQLFSEAKTTRQTLKALPKLIQSTGLLHGLTIGRLSPARGLNLPIWQLEQLRGNNRRHRQRLIHGDIYSNAAFFMIAMLHFEIILIILIYGIVVMFIPPELLISIVDRVRENLLDFTHLIDQLSLLTYGIAIFILEPIYIAGTFSLYLNRRTELEAWDIELNFRQMASRIKTLVDNKHLLTIFIALPLLVLMLSSIMPTQAWANEKGIQVSEEYLSPTLRPLSDAKPVIEELLNGEEFSKKTTQTVWRFKQQDDKTNESDFDLDFSFFSSFASVLKGLLIAALFALIVYIIIKRDQWLPLFSIKTRKDDAFIAPDVLFGMDIRPESLPDNIPATAREYWKAGQLREAMSLLYRGALARLVTIEHIPLHSGHTEGDVVNLAATALNTKQLVYLQSLTKHWQIVAYAHRELPVNIMEQLLSHWFSEFDIAKEEGDLHET